MQGVKEIKISLDRYNYTHKPGFPGEIAEMSCRIGRNPITKERRWIKSLAEMIGTNGRSFSPATFRNGKRTKENFDQMQMLVLDFDGGISLQGVYDRTEKYDLPILFAYETLSSKNEDKFRIAFLNDVPIPDRKAAEIQMSALGTIFPEADKSCVKDISKMYFGGKRLLKFDETIPTITIESLARNMTMYLHDKHGPTHYKKKVAEFAKSNGVALTNKGLLDISVVDGVGAGPNTDSNYIITDYNNISATEPDGSPTYDNECKKSPVAIMVNNAIGDILPNISSDYNIYNDSNMLNSSNVSSSPNVSNTSNVSNSSNVSNASSASNVSNVSNTSNTSNAYDASNALNTPKSYYKIRLDNDATKDSSVTNSVDNTNKIRKVHGEYRSSLLSEISGGCKLFREFEMGSRSGTIGADDAIDAISAISAISADDADIADDADSMGSMGSMGSTDSTIGTNNTNNGHSFPHSELYGIATNLVQIEGGARRFKDILTDNAYFTDKPHKYAQWDYYLKYFKQNEYKPQNCNDFCPYKDSCAHSTNILSTVKPKRKTMERISGYSEQYYPLEEVEDDVRQAIKSAIYANDANVHVINAPTASGKSESILETMKEMGAKGLSILFAAPTNILKDDLCRRAEAKGIEVFKTPSLHDKELRAQLPSDVSSRIDYLYNSGQHYLVNAYIKEVAEEQGLDCLNEYLEQLAKFKNYNGHVITTHRRMAQMDEEALKKFHAVIIDEDFILKSVIPNQGAITLPDFKEVIILISP